MSIVDRPHPSRIDLPVGKILKEASEAGLTEIVICGYDRNQNEYFAASIADGAETLWLLERFKHALMRTVDDLASEGLS